MNALRLLFCGNSLAPGHDIVGRFRMRDDQLLPRFGADSQPEPTAATKGDVDSWWKRLHKSIFRGSLNPLRFTRNGSFAAPVTERDAVRMAPAAAPVAARAADEQNDGVRVLNPFQRTPHDPKPGQTEFRFEKLKVVCNDLHDADFEVVALPKNRQQSVVLAGLREVAVHG